LGQSLNNLANVLRVTRRRAEAEQASRRALALFEQLVRESPYATSYQAQLGLGYYNLGDCVGQAGQFTKAEQAYRKAGAVQERLAAKFPRVADYQSAPARTLFQLGGLLQGQGRYLEARGSLEKALRYQLATVKLRSGASDDLDALWRVYVLLLYVLVQLEAPPDAAPSAPELVRAYARSWQDYRDGAATLTRGVSAPAKTYPLPPEVARQRLAQALADQARALLRVAVQQSSGSPEAQNSLAWFLANPPARQLRDAAQAVELAKKAVHRVPGNATYWHTLGVAHYRAGDGRAAVTALEKARALRPGGSGFDGFFLAVAHWQLGNQAFARSWYDDAATALEKIKPQDEAPYRFRAEAAALMGIATPPPLRPEGPFPRKGVR
jgi:tetratricopeptide (TPR) repeat protein